MLEILNKYKTKLAHNTFITFPVKVSSEFVNIMSPVVNPMIMKNPIQKIKTNFSEGSTILFITRSSVIGLKYNFLILKSFENITNNTPTKI